MPFLVQRNRDGTVRISNAETGKVYAYATTKPTQVMSIVERYHNADVPQLRKSGRRSSARRGAALCEKGDLQCKFKMQAILRGSSRRGGKPSTFCDKEDIDCQLNNMQRMLRGSGRRGGRPSAYSCPPGDFQCEMENFDMMKRYG
jgi:hypothetical protein